MGDAYAWLINEKGVWRQKGFPILQNRWKLLDCTLIFLRVVHMTHIKQIHKVAPKHHNQYLRHGLADEANDPTPPIQKKTFSFITFLWLPDFIFSANAAIVSFANKGTETRPTDSCSCPCSWCSGLGGPVINHKNCLHLAVDKPQTPVSFFAGPWSRMALRTSVSGLRLPFGSFVWSLARFSLLTRAQANKRSKIKNFLLHSLFRFHVCIFCTRKIYFVIYGAQREQQTRRGRQTRISRLVGATFWPQTSRISRLSPKQESEITLRSEGSGLLWVFIRLNALYYLSKSKNLNERE